MNALAERASRSKAEVRRRLNVPRMGRGLAACGACLLLVALSSASLSAAPKDPRLQSVKTWAFAIGDGMLEGDVAARFAGYDLVIVDGEEVQPAQVAALQANGSIVLSYLSVGTIENWRWWYRDVKRFRLDYWGDWGEWYANVSKDGYRRIIIKKVAPWMLKKGVDGLFLDNTDMIEIHRSQTTGMRTLVKRLANLVHSQNKLLFAQNGEDVIGPSLPYYDGWNREDVTWSYDFDSGQYFRQSAEDIASAQAALQTISAAGLLVTATDYVEAGDDAAELECLLNACSVGALSFVSDIDLTRLPAAPLMCGDSSAARRRCPGP